MKKSVMLAVVASMLVSANVAMAGFGVKVPGASKPAASSSQQQATVDVAGLLERNKPILQYLNVAQAAVGASVLEVEKAIGQEDKALLEANKGLGKENVGAINKADSVVKKSIESLNLGKATEEQKGKLKAAMHTCKSYQQLAYTAIGAAGLKAPDLLKDASAAMKSLTKNPTDLSKVKSVVTTCQLAGSKMSSVQGLMKTLNGKLKGVRQDLGTDDVKVSKEDEMKAKENLKAINVDCPAF